MVKIKYRILSFLFCAIFLMNMPIIYSLKTSGCFDARGLCFDWVSGCNNNIRVFKSNEGTKYFKECKPKVDIQCEIKRILDEYFDEYRPSSVFSDKKLLTQALSDSSNIKKFVSAGFLWDQKSYLSKYLKGEIDSSYLGIPINIAQKLNIDLKDFFLYSSRELIHRIISYDIPEGEYQTVLAAKQLATYKLAHYLELDNIVVKSEFVNLITDHGTKVGVITDKAEGIELPTSQNTNLEVNPKFQSEITNLQVLDTITNEQDHNPGNCNFKIIDNQLVGVVAFDNEGGFGLNTNLQKGLCWGKTSPLITKNNTINLPHIGENLAKKILSTQNSDIDELFKNILSDNQLDSLKMRFNQVKTAIVNTIENNNNFLLADTNWSNDTLSEELHGNYGNTYLIHYLKKLGIYKN